MEVKLLVRCGTSLPGKRVRICSGLAGKSNKRTSEIRLADYTAIYSVGNSLAQYLQNSLPATTTGPFKDLKFRLVASSEIAQEDSSKSLDGQVSLFLHRITINQNFRAATRIQDEPNKKSILFLDLHYLITYWGTDAQAEHTVLGWVMQQLQSTPILDNSILTPASIWAPTESIQLVEADLSLEDILRIWDALGPKYRLSLSYIARVVRIDVGRDASLEPLVVANRFQYSGVAP